jgi:hypothetical protein
MRSWILVALVALLSVSAWAQHTTVTAQVKDPTNQLYRTCTGSANFVGQNTVPGAGPYLLGGSVFQTVVPITCDGSARFTVSIADNNMITPTPSQWRFAMCSAFGVYTGPLICFDALITITGTSQDVTAALQAASAPLPPYSAILQTNGVPNGSQSLLNLIAGSNITITDNGVGGVTISSSGGGGGGGGGLPDPGANGVLLRTALNTTATIPNVAAGSAYVSTGTGTLPITQIKPIYDSRDFMTCDGSTNATAGLTTLLAAIGSNLVTLNLVGQCLLNTISIPTNVAINSSLNGGIKVVTGQTVTIQGPIITPAQQMFYNIASGQGSLSFLGNRSLSIMSSVWFGIDCTGVADTAPVWNQILSFVGEDVTMLVPNNCSENVGSTITVSSRAGFRLKSEDRSQNGGGNQRPIFNWSGSSGGMWNFVANQAPTVEGFLFQNGGSAHMDYILQFDGNPAARIGTEAMVRYNTFTNNMANPGTFDAIKINTVSGQNHEKNVITDNDFFCSQSRTFTESSSTQITNGSQNVTCGLANCTYLTDATVGERVRISYATASVGTSPGIQDTTIQSITDNNHLVLTAASTATATNARIQFGQAYGNGITIGSVNSKHNTLDRNAFTQCARGINMTNGSFSLEHVGGSANDVLVYINNTAEPTQLNYVEDENSLRDVFTGSSVDGQITLNHLRNSLGIAGEYDGFIYMSGGVRVAITGSVLQDTPGANQVVIGTAAPGNVQVTAFNNLWSPGVATMANIGYSAWRTVAEAGNVSSGFLVVVAITELQITRGGHVFNLVMVE